MSISPWTIEETRRRIYDAISEKTENDGINIALFFENSSYFGRDSEGKIIPWKGSHPTLVHWPLRDYCGGDALHAAFIDSQRAITAIVGERHIRWVKPENWHSTVFSPVHSGNPDVISAAKTNISEFVRREVSMSKPYLLTMTRIILTNDGGVLAAGYASSPQLDILRRRLKVYAPDGTTLSTIHITLGHLVLPIERSVENQLNDFMCRFRNDLTVLGQIQVEFLTYANYRAPFLEMRIEELFKYRFGRGFSGVERNNLTTRSHQRG